jgi:hypothetical protein
MERKVLGSLLVGMSLMCLVGCAREPTPAAGNSAPAQPTTPAPQAQQPQPAAATQPPLAAAPPVSLASAEGEKPGLRVEIQELKRTDGGTLTLKLAFVNAASTTIGLGDFGDLRRSEVFTLGGINLIDAVGKKKYFVARDSENVCLCSRDISGLVAGSRVNLWAKFPAPPEDVQKIAVMIPHFPPLEDVPIGR